jgi:hypothetical protein
MSYDLMELVPHDRDHASCDKCGSSNFIDCLLHRQQRLRTVGDSFKCGSPGLVFVQLMQMMLGEQ